MATKNLTAPTTEPTLNGHGPRAPRRLAWVEIPDYPDFQAQIWTNPPNRLLVELRSGDNDRALMALAQLVVDTNRWCDCDGDPFPEEINQAWLDALPQELTNSLVGLIGREVNKLPNWMVTRPATASGSEPRTRTE